MVDLAIVTIKLTIHVAKWLYQSHGSYANWEPRSGGDCHSTCSSFGQLCLDEAPGCCFVSDVDDLRSFWCFGILAKTIMYSDYVFLTIHYLSTSWNAMQDAMSIRKIPTRSPGLAPSCLNLHGFPMVGMVIQFIVGVYIRIIRIPRLRWDDHSPIWGF